MKLISVNKCGSFFEGFCEDCKRLKYIQFSVIDGRVEIDYEYNMREFRNYETFAAVIGKFSPEFFFFKQPLEIAGLTVEALEEAWDKLHKKEGQDDGKETGDKKEHQ